MELDKDDLDLGNQVSIKIETIDLHNDSIPIQSEEKSFYKDESDRFSDGTDPSSDESDTATILFSKSVTNSDYLSSYHSFLQKKQNESQKVLQDLKSSENNIPKDQRNPKKIKLFEKPTLPRNKVSLVQKVQHKNKIIRQPNVSSKYLTASMEPKVVLQKINFTGLNRHRLSKKFNYILKPKGKRFIIISLDKSQQESTDVSMSNDCANEHLYHPNGNVTKMPISHAKKNTLQLIKSPSVNINRIQSLSKKKLTMDIDQLTLKNVTTPINQHHTTVETSSSLENSQMKSTGADILKLLAPQKLPQTKKCSVKIKRLKTNNDEMQTKVKRSHDQRKIARSNVAVQIKCKQMDAMIQTDNSIRKKYSDVACQAKRDVRSKVDVGVQVKKRHYNAPTQTDNTPQNNYRNIACQTKILGDSLLKEKAAAEKTIADLKNEMNFKHEQYQKDMLALRTLLHLEQTRTSGLTDLVKGLKPKENISSSEVVVNSEIPHTLLPRQPQRGRSLSTYIPMAPKTYNFGDYAKNSASSIAFKPNAELSAQQNSPGIAEMQQLKDQQSSQTQYQHQSQFSSCRFRSNTTYIPRGNI